MAAAPMGPPPVRRKEGRQAGSVGGKRPASGDTKGREDREGQRGKVKV